MTTLNATEARAKLYSLIDETASAHQPILDQGEKIKRSAPVRGRLERHQHQ